MTRDPRWIGKRALLLLHEESLAELGGARGLRDEGLLDSALARPCNLQADSPNYTLAELAAAYANGILRNHPYVDGNKRTALLAIGLFLAGNGRRLTAPPADTVHMILAAAGRVAGEEELAAWIADNSAPIRATGATPRTHRAASGRCPRGRR